MSVEDNTRPPFPQQLNQVAEQAQRLPEPDQLAIEHSQRVLDYLRELIQQQPQQRISFADYMQVALNAPGLGYYSVGNQKFGAAGDFVTAPEISELFAAALVTQCAQYLRHSNAAAVLEIGAGSGRLAGDLLRFMQQENCLPEHYLILEPSVDLQQRQSEQLARQVPDLLSRVQWLQALPRDFDGVILANEVLDAMPVHRMRFNGKVFQQAYVSYDDSVETDGTAPARPGSQLRLQFGDAEPHLQQLMQQRCGAVSRGYVSEIAPPREAWVRSLANALQRGLILLIDYGYGRNEYYHAQRHMGTMTCHYRHRVHGDPFFYPGLQDITAFVEFTAVAEAARNAALHVAGFATQAQFLLSCGLDAIVQSRMQDIERQIADQSQQQLALLRLSQEMKRLILPSEMGESFKVLALVKKYDSELLGFSQFNLRHKL